MSERLSPQSHERLRHNHGELERMAAERLKHHEHKAEKAPDRKAEVESARAKLEQVEQAAPQQETGRNTESAMHRPVLTRSLSYKHTMISLRHRLKPAQRGFSNVIHSPAVESVSEVAAKTVFRPSVSLGAMTGALLIGGTVYLFARNYGFSLRGSEIIFGLIIGGVLGLLIEGLYKTLFKRR